MATKNITLKKLGKRFVATILAVAMIVSTITIQSTNNIVGAEETAKSTDGYVIENKSSDTITVVINHLLNNSAIYSADSKEVSAYGKINNYKKAVNYEVASVVVNDKTLSSREQWSNIELSNSATVTVNYKVIVENNVDRPVSFYDYIVRPTNNRNEKRDDILSGSINYAKNYLTNETDDNFTVGIFNNTSVDKLTQTYKDHKSEAKNEEGLYINSWETSIFEKADGEKVTLSDYERKGIIRGLDSNNNVLFNFDEPGVFTDKSVTKSGKTNIDNYKLRFERRGDTYKLRNVLDDKGMPTLGSNFGTNDDNSKDFFPLNNAESNTTDYGYNDSGRGTNFYFGMRYDVQFKIGDYQGALNYSFKGDDDLWVLLDGKVIIDLGGIHNAISSGTVDIWDKLGLNKDDLSETDKEKNHRLTILYMERGADASNCYMNFTIPNAQFVDVSSAPKAELTINKVSSEDNTTMLPGATFTLTNDANSSDVRTIVSDSNGKLYLNNLVKGTYTLTEVSAPDDYQITESTYKVKVTNNPGGKTATAKLYKEGGITVIDDNIITNTPNKKIIDDTLDYEKTAKLASDENSWNNREYDITINAKSKKVNTTVTPIQIESDAMLVFDLSASMNQPSDGGSNSKSMKYYGSYQNVKNNLDHDKIYYYKADMINYSNGIKYPKYTLAYVDNQWKTYDTTKKIWSTNIGDNAPIYTWDSRLTSLKEAAIHFINSMSEKSPNSLIGISTFYGEQINGSWKEYGKLVHGMSEVNASKNEIKKKISSLVGYGGTAPNLGLDIAKSELDKDVNDRNKFVVLFTDGEPSNNNGKELTEVSIDLIKNENYKVITIGLGLTRSNKTWLESLADIDKDGNKYAYTTDNASNLDEIFQKIQTDITTTTGSAYTGVKIVDTISKEFKLTDDQKLAINNSNNVSYVENPDGTTTVTWIDQTVGYSESDWTWHGTLRVVAKDEFIGGNDVSTNVPGEDNSYIEIPELGKAELQEPKVNVKLDFVVNNVNEVLFKGETFTNSEEMIKKLFDSSAVTNSKGTEITMYDRDSFSTQLYKADANGEKTAETVDVGEQFTINDARYLDVTYNPGVASNSATVNTNGHTAQENNANVKTGKLDVKFVAGRLAITKEIDSQYTSISQINSNQSFIFKIDQYKVNDDGTQYLENGAPVLVRSFYETISFDANKNEKSKTAYVSELEKGYYVITEESSWSTKYTLTKIEVNGAEVDTSNGSSAVIVGTVDDNKTGDKKYYNGLDKNCYSDIANGDHGLIGFINSIKNWNKWYSDTGFAKNIFKKD